jgi:hypothetical protein
MWGRSRIAKLKFKKYMYTGVGASLRPTTRSIGQTGVGYQSELCQGKPAKVL